MNPLSRRLKAWLRPLERTPLHPQWLVLGHRRDIANWVGERVTGTLLDIGCGEGRLRDALASRVHYIGVDYPVTVALGYAGRPDVFADGASLPFAAGAVDVVTLLDVLEHVPAPERVLQEAARVLRDGGICLIHVPYLYPLHDEPHDFQRWTRHGLARLLAAQGFDVLEIHETTSALEAAAAMMSIALAAFLVEPSMRPMRLAAAPLVVPLIVATNLLGWAGGRLSPSGRSVMTFSYRVVARRRASGCATSAAEGGRG